MTRNEKKTAIENMAERFMNISDLEGKSMREYGDCYSDTDEARFGKWVARVTGFIISIPAALMWWGTPLIVGGLILYDTIQEKNPELCGFTAEEFDKEENK